MVVKKQIAIGENDKGEKKRILDYGLKFCTFVSPQGESDDTFTQPGNWLLTLELQMLWLQRGLS